MIYFYYGDNLYLLEEKLRIFKERYLENFSSGLNFISADFEEGEVEKFVEATETYSMFEEKKLVFVRSPFSLKKDLWEKVEKIIKDKSLKNSEEVIIVFYEKKALSDIKKKSKKKYEFLIKNSTSEEFRSLKGASLTKWLNKRSKKIGATIRPDAKKLLIQKVGNNSLRLAKELDKLSSFKEGEDISVDDVEFLVSPEVKSDIFRTVDALAQKNLVKALESLEKHQEAGDDPMAILGMFIYELRVLILLKEVEEGRATKEDLKKQFSIHPFVLSKNSSLAKSFSKKELKRIYQSLTRVDLAIKTGKKEPQEALKDFVIESLDSTFVSR